MIPPVPPPLELILDLIRTLVSSAPPAAQGPSTPDWLSAIAAILTFCAAVAAGIFAWRAAHWTKQQALSSDSQDRTSTAALGQLKKQTLAAVESAAHQREEAGRANRRIEQARYDARIPTVLVWTEDGTESPPRKLLEGFGRHQSFEPVDRVQSEVLEDWMAHHSASKFRINATVAIENVTDQIGLVTVVECSPYGNEQHPHGIQAVRPGKVIRFNWVSIVTIGELASGSDVLENLSEMSVTLDVHDVGLTVRDRIHVKTELPLFDLANGRLTVTPVAPRSSPLGSTPVRAYLELDQRTSGLG